MQDFPPPADLAQLDARIAQLRAELGHAQQVLVHVDAALRAALAQRADLAARLAGPPPVPPVVAPPPGPPAGPETSTRTVQNVLFVLGGVLLGTAAIAFTIVAWTTYGVIARATILATVTLLALVLPMLALARRLRATAETFAAIGLLLVVLDGYAIWYVDLFHARSLDGARYAGIVAAVTAVFALGYGRLTRLAGPAFVALLAAQPVALLVAAPARPSLAQTSLLAAAVAIADALAVTLRRARVGVATAWRFVAWAAFLAWVVSASITALAAEATTSTVPARALAGTATVTAALALLLGAWVAGSRTLRVAASGTVVAAVVLAAFLTSKLAWPQHAALVFAATTLAVSLAARLVSAAVPAWLRPGPTRAAASAAGPGLLVLGMVAIAGALATIHAAYPLWSASLSSHHHPALLVWDTPLAYLATTTGEVPIALLGLTVALILVGPRWTFAPVAIGGGVLTLLALPTSVALAWWTPPVLDLAGVALLAAAFPLVRGRAARSRAAVLSAAAVLVVDAVLTSTARPGLTALVLAAVLVLGLAFAVLARGGPAGAASLATGLLAAPPAIGSALRAWEVPPWWALRATVATVALLVLAVAVARRRGSTVDGPAGGAFLAAAVSAAVWPLLATGVGEEPTGVYSGVSLVLIAGALLALRVPRGWPAGVGAATAVPGAIVAAVAVLPTVLAISVYPYAWLGSIWHGRPPGVGVTPHAESPQVHGVDAIALALTAIAGGIAAYALRRRWSAALAGLGFGGPSAILAAVVAFDAPWPALPAATLLLGLMMVLGVSIAGAGPARTIVLSGQGAVYVGAGVSAALAVRWTTLTALGVVVVASCVVGAVGRTAAWRVVGCLVTVAAAVGEASAAGLATELNLRVVALIVLGVGTLVLVAGALLRRDPARRAEAIAAEAAASGSALVALTFTAGHGDWSAGVLAGWGLALGVRALVPGISAGVRAAHAAVAGGLEVIASWVLLAAQRVTLVEAYTLPLAAVALLAGWAALRARPELRSWVAYGPALLSGFLPTLATVIATEGEWWRRLGLGAAALVSVVAGAVRRRRAPVVVGGAVLVVVALHELVLLWQRLAGWIPLAVGGAILLFLAITYERRLRDVARLRDALNRMT
ncbi:MAG TPA: hypothetical protein VH561_14220 [Micromonosporaceae bacterium]